MAKKHDHIEDSVRKAFEGFEMPVRDLDWSAISDGLDATTGKKGFAAWWSKNKKRNWIISALLLLLIGSSSILFSNQENNIESNIASQKTEINNNSNNTIQTPVSPLENENKTEEKIDSKPGINSETKTNNSTKSDYKIENKPSTDIVKINRQSNKTNPTEVSTGAEKTPKENNDVKSADNNSPVKSPSANTEVQNPTPKELEIEVDKSFGLKSYGLLKSHGIKKTAFIQPTFVWNPVQTFMPVKLNNNKIGWEMYGAVQANFDNSKATPTAGSAEWNGVQMPSYRMGQLNTRFEAGLGYNFRNWSLGSGLGFEATTAQGNQDDTIRIKIPTKLLPYITLQKDTLWLVVKTRDSIIVLNKRAATQWVELPIFIKKRFAINRKWSVTAGITFNPGILVGSKGNMPNPYAFGNDGFYSKYQYGVDDKTLNNTTNANDYLNKFRFGNSLQLGVEKQVGLLNFGVQLTTKYYYTPIWKTGTPLKQNTFNYGLNIRMGVQF